MSSRRGGGLNKGLDLSQGKLFLHPILKLHIKHAHTAQLPILPGHTRQVIQATTSRKPLHHGDSIHAQRSPP